MCIQAMSRSPSGLQPSRAGQAQPGRGNGGWRSDQGALRGSELSLGTRGSTATDYGNSSSKNSLGKAICCFLRREW
jgi:hypothetical protein